jgi:competence ComEA-like helix-hairpin-helix protein
MSEQKIDLNTATAGELYQLPGIGPTLAVRIITYRETVRPFEEPIEITAVPGISENTYRAIADRLMVSKPAVLEPKKAEETEDVEPTAPEPSPPERALVTLTPPVEPEPEPEAEPRTQPPPTPKPSPARTPSPTRTLPPSPSARHGFAGLAAAALMGAVFGALLALLVIGGINGTLDFGQAEAVVNTQVELDRLGVQANTLRSDLDGLRQRLDRLEGLTARMDGVEQAVDGLDTTLADTQADLDALNTRADQLDADVAQVRAAADRFDTFLDGLRDLLFEFQGAPPTPTSQPTLPPTATPRPTRTPRPSPTPQPTHTPYSSPTPTSTS